MFTLSRSFARFGLASSSVAGWFGILAWLIVPTLAYIGFVAWRDRAVRRRIGQCAWASDGLARHMVVADAVLILRNALGNALCFALAATARLVFA
jgi:hypothetical protein